MSNLNFQRRHIHFADIHRLLEGHSSTRHRISGSRNLIQQILQRHIANKVVRQRTQTTVEVSIDHSLIGGEDRRQLLFQHTIALGALGGGSDEIDIGGGRSDRHMVVHFAQSQAAAENLNASVGPHHDVIDANAERSGAADRAVAGRSSDSLRKLSGQRDEWIEELKVHSH